MLELFTWNDELFLQYSAGALRWVIHITAGSDGVKKQGMIVRSLPQGANFDVFFRNKS